MVLDEQQHNSSYHRLVVFFISLACRVMVLSYDRILILIILCRKTSA